MMILEVTPEKARAGFVCGCKTSVAPFASLEKCKGCGQVYKVVKQPVSRLCVADKYSAVLEPAWLYLPRVRASGELKEYLAHARAGLEGVGKYAGERSKHFSTDLEWLDGLKSWTRDWVQQNKDTATPEPSSFEYHKRRVIQLLTRYANDQWFSSEISAGLDIPVGRLYQILEIFEDRGLITSGWEDIDPEKEGRRPRRYCQFNWESDSEAGV